MKNYKITVQTEEESLKAQKLFQQLGYVQTWVGKEVNQGVEPNHIFAGKGVITWLHNDHKLYEKHNFEEINLQKLENLALHTNNYLEAQMTITSKTFLFHNEDGYPIAELTLEENTQKKNGIVYLNIGFYEGRTSYYNLKTSLLEFLKTESLKHLIFKAFKLQKIESVTTGRQLIEWIGNHGLNEIKKARKNNIVSESELRTAYDELEYLNGDKDLLFFHSISQEFHNVLVKIYGEDYYFLDFTIKSKEYDFLFERLSSIQKQLKKM